VGGLTKITRGNVKDFLYKSFSKAGDQAVWLLDSGRLRILCYHGVCLDRLATEPWMPEYFVAQSAFEKQLQYLQRNASILPLSEAVTRLQDGSLPPRSVSITFDDGYANNLYLAQPLLQKYQMHATVFLSSAYIESGELYPFLKLKLIRQNAGSVAPHMLEYKSNPLDVVMESAKAPWRAVEHHLTGDQCQTLRPLSIDEVRKADPSTIRFGAHSHTHCILRNESTARRQEEIRLSVRKVEEWTGLPVRLFSYPNGEPGDFDDADKQTLRAEGIQAAVTGIGGANTRPVDLLALRRYPLTLGHDEHRFRAELAGVRAALQSVARRVSA
jgi:peptidoglycan/xylan/chitin deacetylase (PgdA/CDA1 family)